MEGSRVVIRPTTPTSIRRIRESLWRRLWRRIFQLRNGTTFTVTRIAPMLVAVLGASCALHRGSTSQWPRLVVTSFPRIVVPFPGNPAHVRVSARIVGPEVEEFYCPEVVFQAPDGTESIEESDCAPFEYRNECWPAMPRECFHGFYLDRETGRYVDRPAKKDCPCNVTGYPDAWSRTYGVPSSFGGGTITFTVLLRKQDRTIALGSVEVISH